jgi:glycerol-3-phosphate acyltransferase PlsY
MAGDGGLVIDLPAILLALIGGYALGSIPFGLVLTRLAGLGDIRKIGSGNIGATNVLRTGNKALALAVLLLDSGKGAVAVLLAVRFGENAALAAAVGAVLGHLYPVWLGFKGGKGVATTLGTLLALSWPVGLIACAVWLLVALIFRISSAAALTALATTPVAALLIYTPTLAVVALLIAALVWYKHAANIRRLLDGTEPRIGRKSA